MPEPRALSLSVIYVSWNSREPLAVSLLSLLTEARDFALDVTVVDNASADGTAQMVRERFGQVALIANDANLGFAVAVNQGLSVSQGQYVLLLNPDALISASVISSMLEFLEACPKVGACSPLLVDDDGASTVNSVAFAPLIQRLDPLVRAHPHGAVLDLPPGPWGRVTRAHWLAGACLLVRREVFEATAGMDAGFFLYWEDIDWCYRCLHAGWEVALLEDLTALHPGGHSAKQLPRPVTLVRMHDGYFRFLASAFGCGVARANFVQWVLNAGVKAPAFWLLSRCSERWAYRSIFESSRLHFCLRNSGRPFWRCEFGRNYAPDGVRWTPIRNCRAGAVR